MSLLNDALRSAEQRRERPAPTAYTGVSAPTSTPAAGRRPQLWLVLLVVVLAAVVWLWWSQTRPDPVTSQPVAEGVVAREPAPATRSPAEPVVTGPGDSESTTAEAEPELVAPPEPETVIAETRAESAETDAAVSGESVEPSSVEPVAASPATASTAAVTEPQTPAPATAESVPASSNDAPSETDTAKTDPAPTQAELAAIKQQRETPELVDRRTDAELKRLLSRGRLAEAEDRLAAVLASQPAPLSRARLARHLIIANEPARALALLPESVTVSHPELRLLKARAHLALGNADQALAALEESVPPVSQNPEYLVTLAALLQQEGRHNDAVGRWAELVAYNDSQAAWWVGLASALEADQQTGGALRAYRQALALSDLSPTLADFCRQRLRALGAG